MIPAMQGFVFWIIVVTNVIWWGYWLSLKLHPWRKCPACGGSNVHRGAVFTYATRGCKRCGGSGRQLRLGASLGIGGPHPRNTGRGWGRS